MRRFTTGVLAALCVFLGMLVTAWLQFDAAAPRRTLGVQGDPLLAPLTPAPSAPEAMQVLHETAGSDGEYHPVPFSTLSGFYYENTPGAGSIPAPVRALSGRKTAVQGFMIPVKLERGSTKTFLLARDQFCCKFGSVPRLNDFIVVRMAGNRGTRFINDLPVTVFGKLEVGEEKTGNGEVISIYRLEANDVAGPLDL